LPFVLNLTYRLETRKQTILRAAERAATVVGNDLNEESELTKLSLDEDSFNDRVHRAHISPQEAKPGRIATLDPEGHFGRVGCLGSEDS
jgi:hypothetical protein